MRPKLMGLLAAVGVVAIAGGLFGGVPWVLLNRSRIICYRRKHCRKASRAPVNFCAIRKKPRTHRFTPLGLSKAAAS